MLCMSTSTIQFTVLTHIEDNKFLLVNIFQNIIYTQIYIYLYISILCSLCRKLYTCLHKKKSQKLWDNIHSVSLAMVYRGGPRSLTKARSGWRRHFSTHSYCSETVGQRRHYSLQKTWKYTSITKSFSCSLFNTLSVPGWNKKMWDRNRP